jgi:hypothetical protein
MELRNREAARKRETCTNYVPRAENNTSLELLTQIHMKIFGRHFAYSSCALVHRLERTRHVLSAAVSSKFDWPAYTLKIGCNQSFRQHDADGV